MRTIYLLLLFIPFSYAYSKNSCELQIELKNNLYFEGVAGYNYRLTTEPDTHMAAVFKIKNGKPYSMVRVYADKATLYTVPYSNSDNVKIKDYLYGGSLSYSGIGTLDKNGEIDNVRVGGTIMIHRKNKGQTYRSIPTIKVEYVW